MTRALCAAACVLVAWPGTAGAQQLSGLVAASVGQTSNVSDGRPDDSRLVSQQYVLGLDTPFLDRDRKSTRLNSSHVALSRMPSSA